MIVLLAKCASRRSVTQATPAKPFASDATSRDVSLTAVSFAYFVATDVLVCHRYAQLLHSLGSEREEAPTFHGRRANIYIPS